MNIVEDVPTDEMSVKSQESNISLINRNLVITSLPQHVIITVSDISGRLIINQLSMGESLIVQLPEAGPYIVTIGNKVTKILAQ
jgi:hypothetical protein